MGETAPVSVFAPCRFDLSAGFPDIAELRGDQAGAVLNVALDVGPTVSVSAAKPSAAREFPELVLDRIAAAWRMPPPRLDVTIPADVVGRGLGASGALTVGIAMALAGYGARNTDQATVVDIACAAEREVGVAGGVQDQWASVAGGCGLVTCDRSGSARTAIAADLEQLGGRLVFVHAGEARNSGSIVDAVLRDTRPRTAARITSEMSRTAQLAADALAADDYGRLAECMAESAALLQALHPMIVRSAARDALRSLGVVAAKPCGAGGSGAIWCALVPPADRAELGKELVSRGLTSIDAAPALRGARALR